MLFQIIFFVALTLFLILLVRRFSASPKVIERAGLLAILVGKRLGELGSIMGTRVVDQARKVKGRIPLLSDRSSPELIDSGEHNFWQEEVAVEGSELTGFFEEGDELFRQGDYAAAEEFFLKAATRHPSNAQIYARLGVIYLKGKNYNDAIEAFKVAVKRDKYNPSRHYNLALSYLGNGDRQKAIACAREAITLDPVTKKYRQLLDHLLERK